MLSRSFTLLEVTIAIALVALMIVLAVPALRIFGQAQSVDQAAQEMVLSLQGAQSKTLASEGASSYGVYFDAAANPNQFTLFKGASYASRDVSADEIHKLSVTLEFSSVNVAGSKVVFDKLTGTSAEPGTISVWQKTNHSQTRTVYVEATGQVGTLPPPVYSDASRIKDSRHVHIDYTGRVINTANESLQLIFPGVTQNVLISQNMQSGQIYWTGTILVSGQNQTLTIATHVLNDVNLHTQFSVHRDKRYNTQPFTLGLTGDAGTIISYDATGQTSKGTSLYGAAPILQ